jgi:hypothetical protein
VEVASTCADDDDVLHAANVALHLRSRQGRRSGPVARVHFVDDERPVALARRSPTIGVPSSALSSGEWAEAVEEAVLAIAGADAQREAVTDRVDLLPERGPDLGRPAVDRIHSSRHQPMKELRAAKGGALRVQFSFDPRRQAILLLGAAARTDETSMVIARHHNVMQRLILLAVNGSMGEVAWRWWCGDHGVRVSTAPR